MVGSSTNVTPTAPGLMGDGGCFSQKFLLELMVDGGNCQSSKNLSLRCIQTRISPKSVPAVRERDVKCHLELLGTRTLRPAGACQCARRGKKGGRKGDRWAAMET